MRKLQNIISNFGTVIARQGNKLVVRIETLRSLRALSSIEMASIALRSYVSELASWLRDDAWQGLCMTWLKQPVGTVYCFSATSVVVKQSQRRLQMRHRIIGRHRTAA
ncbi:MAG: hypothetical protein GXP24_09675 [Planctomycetes bacterium]|nr:hypothetical protein [Planctomycetota bacterium]